MTFHLEAVTANPKLGLKELSIQVIHALHRLQKNKTSTRNESGQEYKNVQINALVRSENKKSTLLSFMRASPHSENHSSASRIERLFLHSEWPFKNIEKKPRRQMEFRSTCNRMMLRKKHGSRPEWLMRFSTCGTCMAMRSSGT